MSGCFKFFLVAAVLVMGWLIWTASRPTDYRAEAEAFCASGVARVGAAAPGLQSRGVVSTRLEERGATYVCAASAAGRTHVVIVRASCGSVLDCAAPQAIADDSGELVWVAEDADVANLPGLAPRP